MGQRTINLSKYSWNCWKEASAWAYAISAFTQDLQQSGGPPKREMCGLRTKQTQVHITEDIQRNGNVNPENLLQVESSFL